MTRRIIDDQLYVHFITFGCYKRRHLLSLDQPKRIVLGVLNQELRRLDAKCIGFVVMPNHVHALVWFPQPGCLSRFLHEWKRHSSRLIRDWYCRQQLHYFEDFEVGIRFWQPKYHAFEIWERAKIEEKLDYIHSNPVHAGLVAKAVDWPWSSARWYLERKSVGVPIDWVDCD
jgi:putative transposase